MYVLCFFPVLANCGLYIERMTSDFNPKLCDFKVAYTHNENGDAVTNLTFDIHVNITKLLVYFNFKVPENKEDHEYRREMIKTVIDGGKLFKGSQSNYLVKFFFQSVAKYSDFDLKLPLAPVSMNF